ncbi:MAG: N-acetyltransferase [Fibrobacteres bacterium]|nr:N-acetyltransferase [Fibrobacterota bacterium]
MESIARIYNQGIEEGLKTADTVAVSPENRIQWYESLSKSASLVYVAVCHGDVVGYAFTSLYRYGRPAVGKTLEVSFYVDREFHRRGVATSLLNALVERSTDASIEHLIAVVIDANAASKGILKKFGFQEWGRFPGVVEFGGMRYDHVYFGLILRKDLGQ